jgi:uncharacterized repeat protein (TIGR01451 family)
VTGSASAQVGGSVNYTLVVANAGPDIAATTQLTYQLAQGLTFVSASAGSAACAAGSSGLITCPLGDLAAAKSVNVTISATANAAGTEASMASVSSTATDTVIANNAANISTTVTAAPAAASAPAKGGGGALGADCLALLATLLIIKNRVLWARKRAPCT